MFRRPIAISLSPNTEKEDVLAALKAFLSPWNFLKGDYTRALEQWFCQSYKVKAAVSFVSGRGALFAILKNLGIGRGDEVILQAFTCVAVPETIITTGARPIFVDISQSLTMDPLDLKRKITKKTKAVIIQHTFGIPADLSKIIKITKEHKIAVIEDCAHLVGLSDREKKLGLFADAAFFSFGRDKAFSSVFGGMAITNNSTLGKKLELFQSHLGNPSFFWVAQQLFHPIAFYFILPFYNLLNMGKAMLVFFQQLHLLSFPVTLEEKQGKLPANLIKKLPNALSYLALIQLKKITEYNQKRKDLSDFYLRNLSQKFIIPYNKPLAFLRFPILTDEQDKIIDFFKKRGIYLGKWYSEVIDPKGVNFQKIFYQKGSCPNAEKMAKKILNLPTYPTMTLDEAKRVMELLEEYVKNSRD